MAFYLTAKKLDFETGGILVAALNEEEAELFGIRPGDMVRLQWGKKHSLTVIADYAAKDVATGQIGLFKDVWKKHEIKNGEEITMTLESRPLSIETIKKKLFGKPATYEEMSAIIKDIVSGRLGEVEMTYFVASGYVRPYSDNELFYLTKAMAETGEKFNLPVKVVDKHSVGGIPGNRITPIVVSIIASLGLVIPKTSSRAITSPAGTADTMEVLCPVSFDMKQIKKIIKKTGACLVWGGGLNMAPADDKIIKVCHPLALEPYDKMIVSIMAKKVATGVDYLVIDMPVGPTAKIKKMKIANMLERRFVALGKKFKMKVKVVKTKTLEPVGRGIGPALEARDLMRVLQQHELRPRDLEDKAIKLAGKLLELKGFCKKGAGKKIAKQQLKNGAAAKKMSQIIAAQGGNKDINSEEVVSGALRYEIHAHKSGRIIAVNNKAIKQLCVNLGAPTDKLAGMHLHARIGDRIKKGDKLFTLYSSSKARRKLGIIAASKLEILSIK
ncbi:thymidine phosphorylase [Candidatus Falkowbacteria bacterium]|nr:thymidine phosphorylase [Candidatus Falkowbacteria bacterium]